MVLLPGHYSSCPPNKSLPPWRSRTFPAPMGGFMGLKRGYSMTMARWAFKPICTTGTSAWTISQSRWFINCMAWNHDISLLIYKVIHRKTSESQRQLFFLRPNNGLINPQVIQNSINVLVQSRHLKIHDGDHRSGRWGQKQEYVCAANLHLNDIGTRPALA